MEDLVPSSGEFAYLHQPNGLGQLRNSILLIVLGYSNFCEVKLIHVWHVSVWTWEPWWSVEQGKLNCAAIHLFVNNIVVTFEVSSKGDFWMEQERSVHLYPRSRV